MISLKSKTTIKILTYYFLNPDLRHYVNEMARVLKLDPKNLYRKLNELEQEGILHSEFEGKQRYFSLNKKSKTAKIYKNLLSQTVGLEDQMRQALEKVHGIEHAYLYGSYAKDTMSTGSDIDLLVVGDHSTLELQKVLNKIQHNVGREINAVNLSAAELRQKKMKKDPFIRNVFSGKHIKLL